MNQKLNKIILYWILNWGILMSKYNFILFSCLFFNINSMKNENYKLLGNLNFELNNLFKQFNIKNNIINIIESYGLEKNNNEIKKIVSSIKDLNDIKNLILLQYDKAIFIVQRVNFDLWIEEFIVRKWLSKISNKKILDFIAPGYKSEDDLNSDKIRTLWLYVLLLNKNKVKSLNIKSKTILKDFYDYIFIITEFLHDIKSSKIDYLKKIDLDNIKKLLIQNFNGIYDLFDLLKLRSPAKSSKKDQLEALMKGQRIIS